MCLRLARAVQLFLQADTGDTGKLVHVLLEGAMDRSGDSSSDNEIEELMFTLLNFKRWKKSLRQNDFMKNCEIQCKFKLINK